jgi:hypothetical protein
MSDLSDKIDWAVTRFNEEIERGKDPKECLGLLFYVKKIYPNRRFPAWARSQLNDDAYDKAVKAGFKF